MKASRRDFVRKLAVGAAYTAPIIRTWAGPAPLLGQDSSDVSNKGGMGKKGDYEPNVISAPIDPTISGPATARQAPWEVNAAPGGAPPPPGGAGPGG